VTKRILVVEDQEDLRSVLRTLLTGSGYEMLEAADGQAGVTKAKSERPDLILMDIQMPVLDGYEATRQIKADPNLKATPIIAVSSFAMKGDEEKARASGCDSTPSLTAPCSSCGSFAAISVNSSSAWWVRLRGALRQPSNASAWRAWRAW
jgi:two-component system cell cycle response regulator DivK